MSALEIADIIGIISFALSGFLIAVHHKLDILGIVITAFLTALGGGMARDIIANKVPYIFTQNLPVILVVCTVLFAIIFRLHKITDLEGKKAFVLSDTIGLASFSISGALIAIEVDFNFFGVLLLSLITAIGGGTLRDIIVNRIPAFLISDFYGSVALIIATIVYTLEYFNQISLINLLITFIFGVCLRLLAYYKQWHLPKLS
jgi:uncharacterized membrane protein YeiH